MGLFDSRVSTGTSWRRFETGPDPDPVSHEAYETREVEKEKEYTEHVATVYFADGDEKDVTFDSMNRGDHGITLKDYTGYSTGPDPYTSSFDAEAFMFIPYPNFKLIETEERIDRSITYETTERVEVTDE